MYLSLAPIIVSIATFFRTINNLPLRNWDEAWYAEITKNMAQGNYGTLMPFWNGRYYFDHPPLYFWLSFPFFKIFGEGLWQTRIISTLAAVVCAYLVYLIAKKLFDKTTAIISLLVFLTVGQVAMRFSHGNLDALLVCLFLATFYFYLLAKDQKMYAVLAGVTFGLGILVKQWLLGLFPILLIVIYSLLIRKKLDKSIPIIVVVGILSCIWWFIAGAIKFGQPFVNWYLFSPTAGVFDKTLSTFSLKYFYFALRDFGLWLLPPVLLLLLFRPAHLEKKKLLALLATASIFLFALNFLKEKLDWYNLPVYPLIAIIVGFASSQLIKLAKPAAALILLILIGQMINVVKIENIYPDRSKVGNDLGIKASRIVPENETLILDDHDFTAFLYYSNHHQIYMVQKEDPKVGEWWILSYQDLPNFLKSHPDSWIVTPNPLRLPIEVKGQQIKGNFEGYDFVKL